MADASVAPLPNRTKNLPRSREGLSLLLDATRALLDAADAHQKRQRIRLSELRKVCADGAQADLKQDLLSQSGDAGRRSWAIGFPSNDSLLPYLESDQLSGLERKHESAMQQVRTHPWEYPSVQFDRWLSSFAEVIQVDEAILDIYRALQFRLLAALDDCADASADTT
ncbi:MAG: hypothetical protein KDA42_13200, partial [Planctomycetales bacterium]|nr:hypothetical protein [Planctomycetales bacterium]